MLWLIIIIILLSIFGFIALSIGCRNLRNEMEDIIENRLGRKLDDIVRQLDDIRRQLKE